MTRTAPCLGCQEPIEQELVPVCDGRQHVWVPQMCALCQAANARQSQVWDQRVHGTPAPKEAA